MQDNFLISHNSDIFFKQLIDVKEELYPSDIPVNSKKLQEEINIKLLTKIKNKIGNKCLNYGYIDKDSIKIVNRSIGRINTSHLNGNIYYDIKCEALVCMPTEGTRIQCKALQKNKAGLFAKRGPLQILIPSVLHPENERGFMETIEKNDMIWVVIADVRIELNQPVIQVIAKFDGKS
jgi:DNA-directed RNA polymerase subunit E'/Rpb7